jgi:ArsR family transcriptional regulator
MVFRMSAYLAKRASDAFLEVELDPVTVMKCLADETRLRLMLLIRARGELCVCDLHSALGESQPKVSRHLAQLRACGLLNDRRQGQWVFYGLPKGLPAWVEAILGALRGAVGPTSERDMERLPGPSDRCAR